MTSPHLRCLTPRPHSSPSLLLPRSYSPHILELKVLESRRVRRSKLYYLRDRVPKEYRIT